MAPIIDRHATSFSSAPQPPSPIMSLSTKPAPPPPLKTRTLPSSSSITTSSTNAPERRFPRASPTTTTYSPNRFNTHNHTLNAKERDSPKLLYDLPIPIPVSPDPSALAVGEREREREESAIGSVSGHPLLDGAGGGEDRPRFGGGYERRGSGSAASTRRPSGLLNGNGNGSGSGNASAYVARASRSRTASRDRSDNGGTITTGLGFDNATLTNYPSRTGPGAGGSSSRVSPVKSIMDHTTHTPSIRTRPAPPASRRRSSETTLPAPAYPGVTPQPDSNPNLKPKPKAPYPPQSRSSTANVSLNNDRNRATGATPPPIPYRTTPSPHARNLSAPASAGGGAGIESGEGSLASLGGQGSVALSYARGEGGVGSPSPGVSI